ncbi:ABC transporter ATP-binding protein [Bosea sp. UNC402CLCol]|uniref:ABC transporter ATP-binding protein n=1 Tax=Bosea sp. UNC402CLCol TaxID=1510531 RepID=UPI00068FB065|nr:ABC transporter ATP-binding protein [Bosea sp. UNC402CLCol]
MPATAASGSQACVVEIRRVRKRFADLIVLDDCSLTAQEGEILTLLGSSGCGKTTLLRCIAGFLKPDAGEIRIDGRDTVPVPVNRRPVGVVFQSYALFPHLTVANNVAYGLKMRGAPVEEIRERVAKALATVSLSGFEERYPSQLSGGQQQRVAIARVLVLEPRVLLLDEPFNALDAKLRGSMQVELRQLIKRLGITAIFVTHDQEEALAMSDRIAVMRAGRIEQLGTPEDIFDRPQTAYVADFVGASNFWEARAASGQITLPSGQIVATKLDGDVSLLIRPHNLALSSAGGSAWNGRIISRRHVGALMEYEVEAGGTRPLRIAALRDVEAASLSTGEAVSINLRDPTACMAYPRP